MGSIITVDSVLYLFSNLFRLYVLYRFLHIFFHNPKYGKNIELICFIGYYFLNSSTYLIFENPLINILTNVVAFFLITLLFNSKLSTKLLSTIIVYALSMVVEIIVYFPIVALAKGAQVDALVSIISDLLLFLISLVAGKMSQQNSDVELVSKRWIALLTIPVGSIFIAVVMFLDVKSAIWITVSACFLLGINFMSFYLYEHMLRLYIEDREKQFLVQQNQAYVRQFDIIEKAQQKDRILRHDLKNQLYSIRALVKAGEQNKALQYLDSMESFVETDERHVNTGNPYVDSMLNYKMTEAVKAGIKVDRDIFVPSVLPMDLFSLNVILGNLFDNAIEASVLSPEKTIKFDIRVDRSTLLIKMDNTYSGERKLKGDSFKTTKDEKNTHGYGLKSIQSILEKYDGTMKITTDNNHFITLIMLYFKS